VNRAGPLDAVLQLGTGYGLPAGLRIATYEDMTVPQALSLPYPEWQGLSRREQAACLNGQASAYAQAAACCFSTRWAAESAIHEYGVPREKVHVVGMGRNHAPRSVPRAWETPRFLFVGGDWERKNGDAVLRAFARVRANIPEARLDVVGGHPRLGLEGAVGHGWLSLDNDEERKSLDTLFETATCFVMPSQCEPSGIVYLEAAAAGIPSIGTTVGGSSELIGDGGCVVDPHDDQALFDAMLRFSEAETGKMVGARAARRADRFTWQAVARQVLKAFGSHSPRTPDSEGRSETQR
jgi:glycosyltransferase involved in cell wall biosynthesis